MRHRRVSWALVGSLVIVLAATVAAVAYAVAPDGKHYSGPQFPGYSPPPPPKPFVTYKLQQLPAHPRVLLLGDSWAVGVGANNEAHGFGEGAFAKYGWDTTVDAFGATGYVNPGPVGHGNYATRMAARHGQKYDLVVLTGGLNDSHYALSHTQRVVSDDIATARAEFPGAQVLVVGPFWNNANAVPAGMLTVNTATREAAQATKTPWVYALDYITAAVRSKYINPNADGHPNNDGYAYIISRFDADLDELLPTS